MTTSDDLRAARNERSLRADVVELVGAVMELANIADRYAARARVADRAIGRPTSRVDVDIERIAELRALSATTPPGGGTHADAEPRPLRVAEAGVLTVGAALMLPEVRSGETWLESSRPLHGGGTETACFFVREGDIINRYTDRWTALTLRDFDRPVRLVPAGSRPEEVNEEVSYCAQCYFNGYGKLKIVDGKCPNRECVLLRYASPSESKEQP